MTLPEAHPAPLGAAQAAFRHAPGRATALAYMDAAIREWEESDSRSHRAHSEFAERMREIRDWLMNKRTP